ncbi:hypothetical protein BT63DRAFT_451742 [Microthyrium microscopicum]|uniref:Uncharacterized protein n=1 Tax=Microthyrium microscopicum TaxID=703497 RepID=A0A6A6UN34_9PEZI|nr:hypothetical protein BT63DRAFT_451742 [Microthyrium microscopicum]
MAPQGQDNSGIVFINGPPPPPPPPYYNTFTGPDPRFAGRKPMDATQSAPTPSSPVTTTVTQSPYGQNSGPFTSGYPSHASGMPQNHSHDNGHHGMSPAMMGAAGALATVAIIFLVGALGLFLCRKTRKRNASTRQQNRMDTSPEMAAVKTDGTSTRAVDTRAYIGPSGSIPSPTTSSPSSASTSPIIQQPEAPVLLSNVIDQSYYTGIDTTDRFSVVDPSHQRDPDAGDASSLAEPPPPYRPRSIPSFSRENSVRASGSLSGRPPSYGGKLSVRSQREQPIRSPFEDPDPDEQETPVSPVGPSASNASTRTRDMSEMSDVSEVDYQQEPTVPHSSV